MTFPSDPIKCARVAGRAQGYLGQTQWTLTKTRWRVEDLEDANMRLARAIDEARTPADVMKAVLAHLQSVGLAR